MSVYEYSAEKIGGGKESLSDYQGQVLLIVNTASKCGFTPQYAGLEELYQKYRDKGFTVLGFPCNQFKNQEPDSNKEILSFCQKNYGVSFPMFAKTNVNGPNALPLFDYLKSQQRFQGFDKKHPIGQKLDEILAAEDPHYENGNEIKWNFTKFLVGPDGNVKARFEPTTDLSTIETEICRLLG